MRPQFTAVLIAAAAATVSGDPVPIANHSFEDPSLSDGGFGPLATGWSGSASVWNPTNDWYDDASGLPGVIPGADGQQVNYISGLASLDQQVGAVAGDTLYTLTVAVGARAGFEVFDRVAIALWAGSPTTGSQLVEEVVEFGAAFPTSAQRTFLDFQAVWDSRDDASLVGEPLYVVLSNLTNGAQANFDNVRLDATIIPTPATLAMPMALVATLARRRR